MQCRTFLIDFLILFFFLPSCFGAKILFFFGGGGYSMKNSAWPWATALVDRGHNVTFLSGLSKQPTDHPKIRDLTSTTLQKIMESCYGPDRFQERRNKRDKDFLNIYSSLSVEICESIFLKSQNDTVLQQVIHNETYDLVIVNAIFGDCGFIMAAKYNAKTILFDSTVPLVWFWDVYGLHPETSWIPDVLMKYNNFPLSLIDRVTNTFWPLYWTWDRNSVVYPGMERIMKIGFGRENVPSFYELEKNTSLVVINSHPATDFAYSLPPFFLSIGGIQTFLPEQEIPQQYQKFMDEAGPGGVVLISFGSTVPLEKVSAYYRQIFFKLIRKHENVRFLLKWKGPLPKGYGNQTEGGLKNLFAADWLPQRELLRHPKLKAFITHGGLNSIQEATYYGVPMIVLPLFAEQDYNAFRIHVQKVGFRLEIRDLTFNQMDESLTKILTDDQYKKNMKIKSNIFRDRPQNPKDTVVYWTEFVLRNDDVSALKPMNNQLTYYQRRLWDVYLIFALIVSLPLVLLTYLLMKIMKLLLGTNIPMSIKYKNKQS